jgi:hypothetical protein
MVTAPLMVLLYDRVFLFDSLARAFRRRRCCTAAWRRHGSCWRRFCRSAPRIYSAGFDAGVTPWTYLMNQTVMIARYLRLRVWPRSLVLAYGIPLPLSVAMSWCRRCSSSASSRSPAVALVRRPLLGFLGLWFFVTLARRHDRANCDRGRRRAANVPPAAALIALAVVAIGPRLRRAAAIALLVRRHGGAHRANRAAGIASTRLPP